MKPIINASFPYRGALIAESLPKGGVWEIVCERASVNPAR
jgi:hypothetical protein